MRAFGAFEGKNNFGKLLDLVEAGEEVVITRHGKPVARLIPNSDALPSKLDRARSAALRIRSRAKVRKAGPFNWEEWKGFRDEGRK
ncbi:type II toxin-antitoxin system Phd/YefM family antitoxin [Occallatibacter savannae]|uniref:type II toxin-antitoxin system Phd/YefM family antitoxin n=1 Tax=Occallatibacter savannae TaxID=1002691 RepID=UPI000D68F63D|nr:type II toxin-antitoxin system prevent-host-death family antitoxin [Occallatibacter savannae]